jgi:glycosyltransferase involved in cell wall biosynthesis
MNSARETQMHVVQQPQSEAHASDRPVLVYVVHSLHPGGAERLVLEMSLAFAAEYAVHVICLDTPGTWTRDVRAAGIPVHCLWRQAGFDTAAVVKLAHHFRRTRADIVHAHQCTPWFYAALARLLCPRPRLLLEEHGRFFPEVRSVKRQLVNRLLIRRLTHRFIAVSEDIRRRLHRYEGLDLEQVEVLYNGVVAEPPLCEADRAALRLELGLRPDDFVVGTVGRFDSIKNLPMLVASLECACRGVPEVRGLLVGDGPQFAEVRTLLERSGLAERVRTPGFRADARKLIQCMDLFVLCSFSEGTSMALLEAMAAGVPVAVTRVGGNPEIVLDGQTGWVIESESAGALTAVIMESAASPGLRRRLAAAARSRCSENFAFNRMIAGYRTRYRELLSMKTC